MRASSDASTDLSSVTSFLAALDAIATQPVFLFPEEDVPSAFRPASVVLLFAPRDGAMSLVLTRRTARVSTHAGEVCFPGGRIEVGEDPIAAALREAEEEIGLDPAGVRIHGRLDDAWAFGGYLVAPIVASAETMPQFDRTSPEVDAILVERLDDLFDPERLNVEDYGHRGVVYRNANIALSCREVLFGLSADLLLEVKDRIERGATERGRVRLAELRESAAAGHWGRAGR